MAIFKLNKAMALKTIIHGTKEYEQMVALRYQILRKPLGLKFLPEELEKERNNLLFGYFDEDLLEGCCMLVETVKGTVRLRQMAVLSGLQGKGIGRALMIFAENVARDCRFKKIIMHARKDAIPFFEKLGYQANGNEFMELTIPHVVMEKEL
jgi:GNAT superfamily N-acetyltransferase